MRKNDGLDFWEAPGWSGRVHMYDTGPAASSRLDHLDSINFCLVIGIPYRYSNWGRTKAWYAATLVSFGARVKFRRRKPSVLVALLVTLLRCWPQSRSSVIVIPKAKKNYTCVSGFPTYLNFCPYPKHFITLLRKKVHQIKFHWFYFSFYVFFS